MSNFTWQVSQTSASQMPAPGLTADLAYFVVTGHPEDACMRLQAQSQYVKFTECLLWQLKFVVKHNVE